MNLLIKLTSLRRIRRLETLWDDDNRFVDAAKCRSFVARNLLLECENKNNKNSLIRAGYGGWLLYTAVAAGDNGFVQELLERDPLLVFGEGEYGVTDILYAAARSKNIDVFKTVFERAISPGCLIGEGGGCEQELESGRDNISFFRWEIVNRAVLGAARGGNLKVLKELLEDCSDVLAYRDNQGATILHASAGIGHVEESWLICLLLFHFTLLVIAIMSRKRINFQLCLSIVAFSGVCLAERINSFLSKNWKSFAGQNYFDPNGLFISVLWSGPLLFLSIIIVVNTLISLCKLMVKWKKAELRHRAWVSRGKQD